MKKLFFYLKFKILKIFLFFFLFFNFILIDFNTCNISKSSDNNFSEIQSKYFFANEQINGTNSDSYVWEESKVKPFSELILSWNAFRPQKGKFSFWVSVKHSYWSRWYKLAEWGHNFQQTFVNTRNFFVKAKHVRIELKKWKRANAFRIKVKAENGAELKNLKALFVCLSNPNNFHMENVSDISYPSICIKGVPKQSQKTLNHSRAGDFCSPTSLSMIINYFYKKNSYVDLKSYVVDFAKKVHDDSYLDIYGNWLLNVAQAFDSSAGNVFFKVERLKNFSELYSCLKKRIPVAVSVRGYLRGGAKAYDRGHFIVIVGWDNKRKAVLCIDPAFLGKKRTLRAYGIKDFLQVWGTSRNLSYVAIPKRNIT